MALVSIGLIEPLEHIWYARKNIETKTNLKPTKIKLGNVSSY